jgi:Zn-dependent protease
MKTSIQIGRIIGIPIKLHITFLLILPIFVWIFAINPAPLGFKGLPLNYIFGSIATILLFTCVIAHELSHSYIAMKNGLKINSITLFIFGGIASMGKIPKDPKVEFKMAIAGPGMSLCLGTIFLLMYAILANVMEGTSGITLLKELLSPIILGYDYGFKISGITILSFILGYINVMLFAFNLIPAFPMDGGRLLRAHFANKMPYVSATKKAVQIGKIIAIIMGVLGLFINPFLILIAFFVYVGASEEGKGTMIDAALDGIKAKDLMSTDISKVDDIERSVSPDEDAIDVLRLLLTYGIERLRVTENGETIGVLSRTDVLACIKPELTAR